MRRATWIGAGLTGAALLGGLLAVGVFAGRLTDKDEVAQLEQALVQDRFMAIKIEDPAASEATARHSRGLRQGAAAAPASGLGRSGTGSGGGGEGLGDLLGGLAREEASDPRARRSEERRAKVAAMVAARDAARAKKEVSSDAEDAAEEADEEADEEAAEEAEAPEPAEDEVALGDAEEDADGPADGDTVPPVEAPWPAPAPAAKPSVVARPAAPPPASKLDSAARADAGRPARLLPRTGYFENTYLGQQAAYLEELRQLRERLPERVWQAAALPPQDLDAPASAGLALAAALSAEGVEGPQRVFLQISLKGSERAGWRRPPLDVVLVVDQAVAHGQRRAWHEALDALCARLGPLDRLGVVLAGPRPIALLPLGPVAAARRQLPSLRALPAGPPARGALAAALSAAGDALEAGATGPRIPGTGTVLLLTRGAPGPALAEVTRAAHRLTLRGAVTSVLRTDSEGSWWQVAQAGHGNDHQGRRVVDAVALELDSLARVIARLLRINVRLAGHSHPVRILGSRMLGAEERRAVKAREEATDRQLSQSLGVSADRGADDDGLQTVIPFFYGGDAHLILLELWVERPGDVAEITLKYKDMLTLGNATARASVRLGAVPRAPGPLARRVRENAEGFRFAEALRTAGALAEAGDPGQALAILDALRPGRAADRLLRDAFGQLIRRGDAPELGRALALAARQRISPVPLLARGD